MLKYLAAIVVILGLAFVVARQDQHAADQAAQKSAELHKAATPINADEQHLHENIQNPTGNSPRWYPYYILGLSLFRWPVGTGTWAILLTLLAIADQTSQTRKAAEATLKLAEIARDQTNEMVTQRLLTMQTLRPRLSVTGFTSDTFNEAREGKWVFVKMKISNSGGVPAYGVIADTWIEFVSPIPPFQLSPDAKYARSPPMHIPTGYPSGFSIPLHRKLADMEKQQMANARGAICFRIRLNYKAFADEVHTEQAFIVRPDEMQEIPEYASAT